MGNGWLLAGDAARSVDPVFSSGVSVAVKSVNHAAEAIIHALSSVDVGASALAEHERKVPTGVDIWCEFLLLYHQCPSLFLDLIRGRRSTAR